MSLVFRNNSPVAKSEELPELRGRPAGGDALPLRQASVSPHSEPFAIQCSCSLTNKAVKVSYHIGTMLGTDAKKKNCHYKKRAKCLLRTKHHPLFLFSLWKARSGFQVREEHPHRENPWLPLDAKLGKK